MRIEYPDLPIAAHRDELLAAIAEHQVVVVAGDTGSGKSTQLPKLCLELGRGLGRGHIGEDGQPGKLIGHTQPRRLAARTIAERVATELEVSLGSEVGYSVRFTDKTARETRLKVMTDGILLAETQRDRDLRRYDTLIIDEAHERSLNIDFLLGYLTHLLPRRPDLKLIVTSATIDTERFSKHFTKHVGPTPIVQVAGRTYPVEMRYRPLDGERDQPTAIADAVDELCATGPGDVLVFLSGEREIRDAQDGLTELAKTRDLELLSLYARLSSFEQHRVFQPGKRRRIVLATNVAETSLTVPGIRFVVDTGTARISRYSRRLKVQRLPIEAISQASANQRSGRCGRVAPGIAIRLFEEDDFAQRDEFTEPEILRTNLASVLLQMSALRLGEIESFAFVEPPDKRSVRDGVELLQELGAFDEERAITPLGKRLARLPIDPRLGRMLLEAQRLGCVRDVLIIAAALSIQDPRERPTEHRGEADALHARFADDASDFVALLNLWTYLREQQKELSSSRFRKLCRAEYLNHLRVREWQDLVSQLRQVLGDLDIRMDAAGAHHDKIHQALLSGLLTHVGMLDETPRKPAATAGAGQKGRKPIPEYTGVRTARFAIAPGSALSRKGGRWVMAGELVETNRLWGRVAARIQPEWIERIGAHLCSRSFTDPRWEAGRGSAVVTERVTMRGLMIVAGRTVHLGRIDPAMARTMFIQHALVDGDWKSAHPFVAANAKLLIELRKVEARTRRDLVITDAERFELFSAKVPADITTASQFDRWFRRCSADGSALFTFSREELLRPGIDSGLDNFPERWTGDDLALRLSYVSEPTDPNDGMTVHVPIQVLNRLRAEDFGWHVAGYRRELVAELIRSLPKQLRRQLVPANEYAETFLGRVPSPRGSITAQMADVLGHLAGTPITASDFAVSTLPKHLRPTFSVEENGRMLATSKDLRALQRDHRDRARKALADTFPDIERNDLRAWDIGTLSPAVEARRAGSLVRGYPSLVDEAGRVAVRVLTSEANQHAAMLDGTVRLLLLGLGDAMRTVRRSIEQRSKLALALSRHGDLRGMIDDCLEAAVEHLVVVKGGPAWDAVAFDALSKAVRADLDATTLRAGTDAAAVLERHDAVIDRLAALTAPVYDDAVVDMQRQIERLVPNAFVRVHGIARLDHIARYLTAMERRIDKLQGAADRDREKMRRLVALEFELEAAPLSVRARVTWLLEELRVSVFAQQLGTSEPVSEERVRKELRR